MQQSHSVSGQGHIWETGSNISARGRHTHQQRTGHIGHIRKGGHNSMCYAHLELWHTFLCGTLAASSCLLAQSHSTLNEVSFEQHYLCHSTVLSDCAEGCRWNLIMHADALEYLNFALLLPASRRRRATCSAPYVISRNSTGARCFSSQTLLNTR